MHRQQAKILCLCRFAYNFHSGTRGFDLTIHLHLSHNRSHWFIKLTCIKRARVKIFSWFPAKVYESFTPPLCEWKSFPSVKIFCYATGWNLYICRVKILGQYNWLGINYKKINTIKIEPKKVSRFITVINAFRTPL